MSYGGGEKQTSVLGGGVFGKESTTYDVYLNLTPLMDVMSNILFFLLAAFGSTLVAVLPTTVPVRSSDAAPAVQDEAKVNVTLRADAIGLTVGCDSQNIDPSLLQQYRTVLPKRGDGSYDHAGLTAALRRIKERYPSSKTMVLVPDDDMPYEVIVKIMDAARDYGLPSGQRIMLFDEVVMSSTPASESKRK